MESLQFLSFIPETNRDEVVTEETTTTKKRISKAKVVKKRKDDKEQKVVVVEEVQNVMKEGRSIEEEEIEEEFRKKHMLEIKIKMKSVKPVHEDVPEEGTDEFDVSDYPQQKSLPLTIASERNESTVQASVSSIVPDKAADSKANVEIVPQRPLQVQETQSQDKEVSNIVFDASKLLQKPIQSLAGLNQGLEISEVDLKQTSDTLDVTTPQQSQAKSDIVSVTMQAAQIQDVGTHESETKLSEFLREQEMTASTKFVTHDATMTIETLTSDKEEKLPGKEQPIVSQATEKVLQKQGVQVTETVHHESELLYSSEELNCVQPKYTIKPHEVIEKSEVVTADQPGKYTPELIVATEIARKDIVPVHGLITQETNVSELEDMYTAARQPQTERAELSIKTKQSYTIQETLPQESESDLFTQALPGVSQAVDAVRVQESLKASTVQAQSPVEELALSPFDLKSINVTMDERTPVISSETEIIESERLLETQKLEQGKKAVVSVSTLSVGEHTLQDVAEMEQEYDGKVPLPTVQAKSLTDTYQNIAVEEQTVLDSSDSFERGVLKTESAQIGLTLQTSKAIEATHSHEKESELVLKSSEIKATAEKTIQEHSPVEVTAQEVVEAEKPFLGKMPMNIQTAKQAQNEGLRTVQQQEVHLSEMSDVLEYLKPLDARAKVQSDEVLSSVVHETVTCDSLRDYTDVEKPLQAAADVAMQLQKESITVSIAHSDMREEETDFAFLTAEARPDFIPYRTPVQLEHVTADICEMAEQGEIIPTKKAKATQEAFEATLVQHVELSERESELLRPDSPEKRQGSVSYDALKTPLRTEHVTNEAEEWLEIAQPQQKNVEASLQPHESLQVNLIEASIREETLSGYEQPKSVTASGNISELLVSQKHETLVASSTGHLDEFKPTSDTGSSAITGMEHKAPQINETLTMQSLGQVPIDENSERTAIGEIIPIEVISKLETVLGEYFHQLKDNLLDTKTAEVLQTYVESAQIHEVLLHDRESEFGRPASPEKKQGFVNFEALEAAKKTETTLVDNIEQLEILAPEHRSADIAQTIYDAVQVHETTVSSKESVLKEDVKPNTVTAVEDLNEIVPLQSLEVYVQSGTQEMPKFESTLENAGEHHIIVDYKAPHTSEIIIGHSLGTIDDLALNEQKATSDISEVTVPLKTENIELEHFATLLTEKPEDRQATMVQTYQESIEQRQDFIGESEKLYEQETQELKQGSVTYEALKTAIKSETVTNDNVEQLDLIIPEVKQSVSSQAAHEALAVNIVETSQKESELILQDKPKKFTAKKGFEELQISSKSEIIVQDSTKDLVALEYNTEMSKQKPVDVEHKIADKQEVVVVDTLGKVEKFSYSEQKATSEYSDLRAPVSEITHADDHLQDIKPDESKTKHAEISHILVEGKQIVETLIHESERHSIDKFEFDTKTAEATMDMLRTSLKSEVIVDEAFQELETKLPEAKQSMLEPILMQAVTVESTTTASREENLKEFERPKEVTAFKSVDGELVIPLKHETQELQSTTEIVEQTSKLAQGTTKTAEVEHKVTTTSEIVVSDSTGNVDDFELNLQKALPEYSDMRVPQTHETVVEDSITSVEIQEQERRVAEVSQDFVEGVVVHESLVHEQEMTYDEKPHFETKTGSVTYETLKAALKDETLTSENTSDLQIVQPEEKLPSIAQLEHEAVHVHEAIVSEREFAAQLLEQPKKYQAIPNINELILPQQSEVLTNAGTEELIIPEVTLQTSQFKSTDTELKMPSSMQPQTMETIGKIDDLTYETKTAQPDIEEFSVATTAQDQSLDQTQHLEEIAPDIKQASTIQGQIYTMQVHEVIVGESEGDFLTSGITPAEKSTSVNFDVLKTALHSETTIVDNISTLPILETEHRQAISSRNLIEATEVHEVTLGSKETELSPDESPKKYTAQRRVNEMMLPEQSEVLVQSSAGNVIHEEIKLESVHEKLLDIEYKIPSAHEVVTGKV